MNKTLDVVWTNQFKKDYKLASCEQLLYKNEDHALSENVVNIKWGMALVFRWGGTMDCKITIWELK